MTTRVTELAILFFSVAKWFLLATIVGLLVGLSSTVLLIVLQSGITFAQSFPYAFLLLPVSLALSGVMTARFAFRARGYGMEQVIRAIHQEGGKIHPRVIPVKFLATVVTITSGGSAGNIGPCAQIGGALCSMFGQFIRLEDVDRVRLVVCGISAGFAAVFGTPVAGALFAIEALWVGRFSYGALFPSLVSAFVGHQVAANLGVAYLSPVFPAVPSLNVPLLLTVGLAGVTFGLAAFAFVEIMGLGKRVALLTKTSSMLTGVIGGFILIGVTFLFSDDYLGLGWTTVAQALKGDDFPWYAFAVKLVTTSVTLNFGGSGGILFPLCFYGAALGSTLAQGLGVDPATLAALGFVSVLAGATNTPIASLVLAIELFGPTIAPYAAVTCAMSYLLTGHRSVIPTQLLHESKSPSFELASQQEIERVTLAIKSRRTTLTKMFFGKRSSSESSDK